mmetsp:Transcript_43727/g.98822  ORF Transcript_43727/g.98822 Transcript_43727/m.98822 type:complete len:120 (-) Transcript_43727:359-718(-)
MALKFVTTVKDTEGYVAHVLEAPKTTLCVVDCYAGWAGPCDALNKKIQNLSQDMIDFDVRFVQAQVDEIEMLEEQVDKSKPLFLFFKSGSEVGRISGADAVQLQKLVEANATKKVSADE